MIKDIARLLSFSRQEFKINFKSLASWTARSGDGSETKHCTTLHKSLASNP